MKKLLIALMLCAPMTMFAQKFGHIDSQALLMSLPEAVAVQNELQAKGNEYQKQLEDMQKASDQGRGLRQGQGYHAYRQAGRD